MQKELAADKRARTRISKTEICDRDGQSCGCDEMRLGPNGRAFPRNSGWTAFDDEAASGLSTSGSDFEASFECNFAKLGERVCLSAEKHHFDCKRRRSVVRSDAAHDDDTSMGSGGLCATAQDRNCFTVGPVVKNLIKKVDLSAGRKRFKETLPN